MTIYTQLILQVGMSLNAELLTISMEPILVLAESVTSSPTRNPMLSQSRFGMTTP